MFNPIIKSLFAFIIVISICSCDNRKNFVKDGLPNPILTNKGQVSDSVKLTLKSDNTEAVAYLNVQGISGKKVLSHNFILGSGIVKINNDTLNVGTGKEVNKGDIQVKILVEELGMNIIMFKLKDEFDKETSIEKRVFAFDNLSPVIQFTEADVKFKGVLSPLQFSLDASRCFDKDAKWGGFIKSYEYKINDLTFTTKEPKIDWIFSGRGNYNISLKITDSDNNSISTSFVKTIN